MKFWIIHVAVVILCVMNDDKRKNTAREILTRYITDHRKRCTPERYAVLDMIMEMPSRFSIDQLYEVVENSDFRVSRATVYNSVNLFGSAGILRRFTPRPDLWEVVMEETPTVKLICCKCGKIREIVDRQLAKMLALKRYQSFVPDRFEVYMHGYCTKCRPKNKRGKK